MSKKISLLLLTILAVTTVFATSVLAQTDPFKNICTSNPDASVCQAQSGQTSRDNVIVGPNGIVTNIIQALVWVIGVVSVVLIIIGAIKFTTSAGDPNSTKSARDTVIYAIIGLIVAIFSQIIVTFVLSRLTSL